MKPWIRRLFGCSLPNNGTSKNHRNLKSTGLRIEHLEDRITPAIAFDDFDIVRGTTNGDPWFDAGRPTSTPDELTFDPAENVISRTITPNLENNTSGGEDRPGLAGSSFFDWFGIFRRDQNQNGVTDGAEPSPDGPFDMFDDSVDGFSWSFPADDFGFIRSDAGLDGGAFGILDDDALMGAPFGEVEWVFDVTGFQDFNLSVDIAAIGDFETSDFLSFEMSLDGGANWTEVLALTADEASSRTYGPLENGNDVDLFGHGNATTDPVNDPLEVTVGNAADVGTEMDIIYQTIQSLQLPGSALNDQLHVRMRSLVNSGTEYISFDNVQVSASTLAYSPPSDGMPDAYTLILDGVNLEIRDTATGAVLRQALAADITSVVINGGADSDTLTVDFSGGDPIPTGGVQFDGGDATTGPGDTLEVTGSAPTDLTYTPADPTGANGPGSGDLTFDGSTITFSGLEPLLVNATPATVTIDLSSLTTSETVTISDGGMAGQSQVTFANNALEDLVFNNPTTLLEVIGTGGAAHTINVEGLDSGFDANLTIDADGDDTVNFQNNATDIGNGNLTADAMTINVMEAVSTATTGTIDLTATRNIVVTGAAGALTSATGDITLTANAGGTTGTFTGVSINSGATVVAQGGAITISGTGGTTGAFNDGVFINNASVTNTGNGMITITGTSSSTGNSSDGVTIENNANVTTADGALMITGTSVSGNNSNGVDVRSNSKVTSNAGPISITGTNTGTGTGGDGLLIEGSGTQVSSTDGDIVLKGDSTNGDGVVVNNNATISSGSGAINITGTGGADGITLQNTSTIESMAMTAGAGNIVLLGTGTNTGILLSDGTLMSVARDITLTGNSDEANGISLFADSVIKTTGMGMNAGDITLTGTGGTSPPNTSSSASGVSIGNSGSDMLMITTVDGNIRFTGTATEDAGVTYNRGQIIESTGVGSITFLGTATTSEANSGVFISDPVASNSGTIMITGSSEGPDIGDSGVSIVGMVTSTTGAIVINGTADNTNGVSLLGTSGTEVSTGGTTGISITGTSNSATPTDAGVFLNGNPLVTTSTSAPINIVGNGPLGLVMGDPMAISGAPMIASTGSGDITISGDDVQMNLNSEINTSGTIRMAITGDATQDISAAGFLDPRIIAGELGVSATGNVDLQSINQVGTLAIDAGGTVDYNNTSALVIDSVTASMPFPATSGVTGMGDVSVTVADSAMAGDDLTLNPGITVESTGGSVTLTAGDNVDIDGDVSASTTATFNVDPSMGDPDATGGTIDIDTASVITTGGGAFLNGGDDNDTFTLEPQTTTTFEIDGNPPVFGDAGVPPGDTLNLDLTGVTPQSLTTGPGQGDGQYTFMSAGSVSYISIETVVTNPAVVPLPVTFNAAAGQNYFEFRQPTAGTLELLVGPNEAGAVLVDTRDLATVTSYTVNGADDNDLFVVNYSAAGGQFNLPLTFNGQTNMGVPGDSLEIRGGTATEIIYTPNNIMGGDTANGTIDLDGTLITFTGLEPALVTTTADTVTIDLSSLTTSETVTLTDGGMGQSQVAFASNTLEDLTFTNPTMLLQVINTGGAAHTINVEGLGSGFDANLTIDADGDDTVNFQTNATDIGTGNLMADAQTINVNAAVDTSGAGIINLDATQSITSSATGSLTTVDGNITLAGNAAGTATGMFDGINLVGGTISSANGAILLTGEGGDAGNNDGVALRMGATIESTGTGTITIIGTSDDDKGIAVEDGMIVSGDGNILLMGTTNDDEAIDMDAGTIASKGAATITLMGTSMTQEGVEIDGGNILSVSGNISITGTTQDDQGVQMDGGTISSMGTATITITGTGSGSGTDTDGVVINGNGTQVTSMEGAILITGDTAGETGVQISGGAVVSSIGTGMDAATITINAPSSGANSDGVLISGMGTQVTSADGAIAITAGDSTTAGDDITITGEASVSLTGTMASTITLTAGDDIVFGNATNPGIVTMGSPDHVVTLIADNEGDNGDGDDGTITQTTNGTSVDAAILDLQAGQADRNPMSPDFDAIGTDAQPFVFDADMLTTNTNATTGNQYLREVDTVSVQAVMDGGLNAGLGQIMPTRGHITLDGGTFNLDTGDGINDESAIVVRNATIIDLMNDDETIGSLASPAGTTGGVTFGTGTLTTGGNGLNTTFTEGDLGGAGSGGLTKEGTGSFRIDTAANATFTGQVNVNDGVLVVNTTLTNSDTVEVTGGTLGGTGTLDRPLNANAGGTVSPGDSGTEVADPTTPATGILSTGTSGDLLLDTGSTFFVDLNGNAAGITPGTDHDQLAVTGTVTINDATLDGTTGVLPLFGNQFIIIDNDGTDVVVGTFASAPEGAIVTIGGVGYQITYAGGDGNDVVLTRVARFDLNTPTSPRAFSYVGVVPTQVYMPGGGGFGWVGGPAAGFDRGGMDFLFRDGHFAGPPNTPRTFRVNLDPTVTTYQVTVHMGDLAFRRGLMEIQVVEGTLLPGAPDTSMIFTAAGEVEAFTFQVQPDGNNNIALQFNTVLAPGTDPYWVVNAIDFRPAEPQSSVGMITLVRTSPGTDPLTADGTSIDTYQGTGAPPDAVVTVEVDLGTITSADIDSTIPGIQVMADASGTFTFTHQRPTGIGPANFTATEVTGLSMGTLSQPYQLPATGVRRLDFDSTNPNVTEAGFLGVQPDAYVSAQDNALGWDTAAAPFDRGGTMLLERDGHYSGTPGASNTFRLDLPNPGTEYQITVLLGDLDFSRSSTNITITAGTLLSDPALLSGISTAAGELASVTFLVQSDGTGQVALEFSVAPGTGRYWVVNALDARPNTPDLTTDAGVAPITITRDDGMMGSTAVKADGLTVDSYTGSGVPAGTLVTLSVSGGELMVTDASPLYQGIQVMADGSGEFSFDLLRPNGTMDVTIEAVEVTGLARTLMAFTQTYEVADTRRFDFNGTANDTEAGFVGVRGNQTATVATLPSLGFGWENTASEFTRSGPDALLRDGHFGTSSTPNTFLIQVDPGTSYDVTVHLGDNDFARDQLQVTFLDGPGGAMLAQYTVDSLAAGMFDDTTTPGLQASSGTLAVLFEDVGGNVYWVTNGIEIAAGTPGPTQLAAGGAILDPVGVEPLSDEQLAPLAQEAITRWLLTDLSTDQQAQLESVQFHITDLSGAVLGQAPVGGSVVSIDATAAGHGWFIDPTPAQDEEYRVSVGATEGIAVSGAASEGIDLLSVLMHELGHILGHEDIDVSENAHHLMTATLGTGVRRLPEGLQLRVGLSSPSGQPAPTATSTLVFDDVPGMPVEPAVGLTTSLKDEAFASFTDLDLVGASLLIPGQHVPLDKGAPLAESTPDVVFGLAQDEPGTPSASAILDEEGGSLLSPEEGGQQSTEDLAMDLDIRAGAPLLRDPEDQ